MQIVYKNTIDQAGKQVLMNDATYEHIKKDESLSLWTDHLKGCVVTVLHLEHAHHLHTVALCHFSHDKKTYHKQYLEQLFIQLAQQNQIETVTKASCMIVPPGIPSETGTRPIIDPEWKNMICKAIRAHLPDTHIYQIPYLFNTHCSAVTCVLKNGTPHITIVNKSSVVDTVYYDQLMECHSYQKSSPCARMAPLIIPAVGLAGYIVCNMQ